MSRIKIKLPNEKPLLTVSIQVRIGDVNHGGHVGNDSILSIIHEARVQLLDKYELKELDVGGCGLIMGDVGIVYKAESFYKDILTVDIYTSNMTLASFDLLYDIQTSRNNENIRIALAKTGMICFDYNLRNVVSIPESLKTILKGV